MEILWEECSLDHEKYGNLITNLTVLPYALWGIHEKTPYTSHVI